MARTNLEKVELVEEPWQLPEGWVWMPLAQVCEYLSLGKTPKYANSGPLVVKTRHVYSEGFREQPTQRSSASYQESSFLRQDDLLMTATGRGAIGRLMIVPEVSEKLVTDSHIFTIRTKPIVLPQWLLYFLKSPDGQKAIFARESGTAFAEKRGQTQINASDFSTIKVPVPFPSDLTRSLNIQRQIVVYIEALLDEVKEARRILEQMHLDAEETLDSALIEVFDKAVTDKWTNKTLLGKLAKILATLVDPRQPQYKKLPHIGVNSIQSSFCKLGSYKTAEEDGVISGKYLFEPGMVLYSKIRPYLRKAVLVDFRGLCSADIYPLSVISNNLLPRFLMWSLISDFFTRFAINNSGRAQIPKINRDTLFSYELLFPRLEEQQRIVLYLDTVKAEVEEMLKTLDQDSQLLNQLEQSILEDAFRRRILSYG